MRIVLISLVSIILTQGVYAQSMHFSQFNQAPLLLNPANTGLLQENDWRAGANFRNQWSTVPVPYNTFSMFFDCGLFRERWETSWLGLGFAAWRDVAGNGNLALTKIQGNLAYHVLTSDRSSFSAGLGAGLNQRSVDFSKLTFDRQWDEFSFNRNMSNQETFSTQKTQFLDLSLGSSFAYYNNTNVYFRLSVGARNINQPVESFYGANNKLGLRPIANIDLTYKASDRLMISPSVYYTRQKKASELVTGSLFSVNVGETQSLQVNEFLIGGYYRLKDAAIVTLGYKFLNYQFMVSYDHTLSQMSAGNNGIGALEISLIKLGNFRPDNDITNTYGCPRF